MKILLNLLFICTVAQSFAQTPADTETILRNFADDIVSESTWQFINQKNKEIYKTTDEIPKGIDVRIESPHNTWLYCTGILNMAMIELGEALDEQKYIDFSLKNMEFAFENYTWFEANQTDMTYWVFPFGMLYTMDALDCCGAEGASLMEVCRYEQKPEYVDYIEKAGDYILHHEHRLADGTFARKSPAEMTVWADDLYMGLSFLSRYGEWSKDSSVFNLAVKQVIQFNQYLYNPVTQLYHHGWYSDIEKPNIAHWGRANGWVMMAQINLLDHLPEDHPTRPRLLEILQEQVIGVSRYQTENGMWRQLLDKPDSYLETSCSAMFTYSIARAVRKGYLDERYASIARRGWEGLKTRLNDDGKLTSVCRGTSMRNDLVFYYTRPQVINDRHGVGSFILAGIEMMRFKDNEK